MPPPLLFPHECLKSTMLYAFVHRCEWRYHYTIFIDGEKNFILNIFKIDFILI